MNLHQIRALCAVVHNRFSISGAATALKRSQPQLSREIKELEFELGVRLFSRTRNKVIALTPQGEEVLQTFQRILSDIKKVHDISAEGAHGGELRIATTHVHARYSLPKAISKFIVHFPNVTLTLRQGDPHQCCDLVVNGASDIGITTVAEKCSDELIAIPIYKLLRCVIAPKHHEVLSEKPLTIKKLSRYPIVAYSPTFSGRSIVEEGFARAGLQPNVVCSAIDADVSKTYVGLGMGIAILASIAFDQEHDHNLATVDVNHLFRPGVLNLVLRKHNYLSERAYSFITMFAPHISRDLITKALFGGEIDRVKLSQRAPVAKFH